MTRAHSVRLNTADRLLVTATRIQRRWLIIAVGGATLSTAGALLLPGTVGGALDAALSRQDRLPTMIAALGALIVAVVIAEVIATRAAISGAATTTAWFRHRMLATLLRLGLPGQQQYPPGDAAARITTGASAAGQVLPLTLTAFSVSVTTVAALVALALIDWTLPATLVVAGPLVLLLLRPFTRQATTAFTDYQRIQGTIAARLMDALAGLRTIRASGTADREVGRVLAPLPDLRDAGMRTWALQRQLAWSMGLLAPVLQIAVLAAAGWAVSGGRITPGQLVAAVGYSSLVLAALEQIDALVELTQVRAGAARVKDLAVEPAKVREAPAEGAEHTGEPTGGKKTRTLPEGRGRVEFRDVVVRRDGRVVLNRINLFVPAGATIAIVGPSGAGKSVLVGLLGGLTIPDSGCVLIDGCSVRGLDRKQLRSAVAYAFERPTLLGSTVREAVAYGSDGRLTATSARVRGALRAAHAETFVRRLPAREHTSLSQVPLSGGEQQRLGLARAVAQNARVLVLDDATSSLDTATEAQVTSALTDALPGRTRLVVTHRIRTAARADAVAWLDQGRIQAIDSHASLWADARYRALFGVVAQRRLPVGVARGAVPTGPVMQTRRNGNTPPDSPALRRMP